MITVNEDGEIITPFIRTPYNYNADSVSLETGTFCEEETKTKQEFKDDVDINNIVEKFGITGEMPESFTFPDEQDFTETTDYQSAMNVLVQARESFMELPAKVRARFDNDPQQFMEFFHDPANQDEAVRLGLATKKPEPKAPEKTELQELNENLKGILAEREKKN